MKKQEIYSAPSKIKCGGRQERFPHYELFSFKICVNKREFFYKDSSIERKFRNNF